MIHDYMNSPFHKSGNHLQYHTGTGFHGKSVPTEMQGLDPILPPRSPSFNSKSQNMLFPATFSKHINIPGIPL